MLPWFYGLSHCLSYSGICYAIVALQKHFASNDDPSYIFGLNLRRPKLTFNQIKPGHFKVISSADKRTKHNWTHADGTKGSVSSSQLINNWDRYTSEEPVYGSAIGIDGQTHLLFQYKSLRFNKNGKIVASAKLHDYGFLKQNEDLLKTAHGFSSVSNHLKLDPNSKKRWLYQAKNYDSGQKLESDSRSYRSFESGDNQFERGPLSFSFCLPVVGCPSNNPSPSPAPAPAPAPAPLPAPIQFPPPTPTPTPTPPIPFITNIFSNNGGFTATSSAAWQKVKKSVNQFNHGTSSTALPFSYTWEDITLTGRKFPISADLTITPRLEGSIDFGGGLTSAAANHNYIPDIKSTLTTDFSGNISAGKINAMRTIIFPGPSDSITTDFGQLSVNTGIKGNVTAFSSSGDPVSGQLFNANAEFSPSASLDVIGGKFYTTSPDIKPTVDITGFETNARDFSAIGVTVNPFAEADGTIKIPSRIPFIGGNDLATMTFDLDNYIKLNASNGNIVTTIEGDLSANVTLLGKTIIDESFTMYPPVTI
ncbi:hypothetical protein [Synechococcus sp. CC9616]|uniref:hypothetical protein n=1 Tax=Synechococcus sp. CC9616 TaxID=110663 RepID=UPI0004B9A7E3|nr:hypothetical protein [Synechococcus sp. CC9616]